MSPRLVRLTVIVLALLSCRASTPAPLHILEFRPGADATPGDVFTITFDRPVVTSLEDALDPTRIVSIDPPMEVRVDWRDPSTLRVAPSRPLTPGTMLTLTVDTNFTATGGEKLPAPERLHVRVRGARRLGSQPALNAGGIAQLDPSGEVRILYSAPVDDALLERIVRFESNGRGQCASTSIRYQVQSQRPPTTSDRWPLHGGRDGEPAQRFERLVELRPRQSLPEGCEGVLVIPSLDSLDLPELRYRAHTIAPFHARLLPCPYDDCLTAPTLYLAFSTPVPLQDLASRIHFEPPDGLRPTWGGWNGVLLQLQPRLTPRTEYRIIVDTSLRDVYGRRLTGSGVLRLNTGDYLPGVGHFVGLHTVTRRAGPVLKLRHVNVDSVDLEILAMDDTAWARVVTEYGPWANAWSGRDAVRRSVGLPGEPNEERVTAVALPELDGPYRNRLVAVRVRGRSVLARPDSTGGVTPMVSVPPRARDMLPTSVLLLQYTDLMVHTAVGEREGSVFVTQAGTGAPVENAAVRLVDAKGDTWATGETDRTGVAHLSPTRPVEALASESEQATHNPYYGAWSPWQSIMPRLVEVRTADDRVILPIQNPTGWYGNPDRGLGTLNGSAASRPPSARALVFTDRDIYRPGEWLHAAAILREGPLDSLRAPERTTRVRLRTMAYSPLDGRWTTVEDREHDLSRFGAATDSFRLAPAARLGTYQLEVSMHREGSWRPVSAAHFAVAEYRAPEFLLNLRADSAIRLLGDTARARLSARFLFDAPMGHARVEWSAVFEELPPWDLQIANLPPGFQVGDWGMWWMPRRSGARIHESGEDTLDASGVLDIAVPSDGTGLTRGARLRYDVGVTDVNRQTVTASASQVLHGSTFYLAVRDAGTGYFWTTGARQRVEILATRPDGRRVAGARVRTTLVRARWVQQTVANRPTGSWSWFVDTLQVDSLVTADTAVAMSLTPTEPGYHALIVTTEDEARRPVRSSVARYVVGGRGFRWGDVPTRLDVVLSKDQVRAGDTTVVAFSSPFDSAEAWVTVERERVLWHHRMTVRAGPASVPVPVTAALIPNATVSVLLVNRADAASLDSLHHRVRHGTGALTVDLAPRRLEVSVRPERPEYAPADSAVVLVDIRNARGVGTSAAVALWAVDEGVLSLTGYQRPDPATSFYSTAGSWLLHATSLTSLRDGDPRAFLRRMIGYDIFGNAQVNRLSEVVVTGVTGAEETRRLAFTVDRVVPTLRQDFRTTAFFRAFVTTDDTGHARVSIRLPDNVTTFRLIAVAASGTEFGSGESPLVATRPLIIRAALPRFVRAGDEFTAGGVVNARDARPRTVVIRAAGQGLELVSDSVQAHTLSAAGTEARYRWRVPPGDSIRVELGVTDGTLADRVSVGVPVRPEFSPRAHTLSGVARGSASVAFVLPPEIDPERSRLTIRVGSSPMPTIHVAGSYLRAYPYLCTEQLTSVGRWLVAMLTLHDNGASDLLDASGYREELQRVVGLLERRQGGSGGFGYWSSESWYSTWLDAHVGLFLLDARDRGATVGEGTIPALTSALVRALDTIPTLPQVTYGTRGERRRAVAARLADRLAAARFLQRVGDARADPESQRLIESVDLMWWEDQVELAYVLQKLDWTDEARAILSRAWEPVRPAGNRIEVPDSLLRTGFFVSGIRPVARLLSATLAIEPSHPRIGALVERIVQRSRAEYPWYWNTQDHAAASMALADFMAGQRGQVADLQVRSARTGGTFGTLATLRSESGALRDTTIPLSGLVEMRGDSALLKLSLNAAGGPVFYALTVDEVPLSRPLRPDNRGISVERWYERFDDGRPVTELVEGELVRVRLRVTVTGDREFVAVEDPLPAGLEAVDLSLRTSRTLAPFASPESDSAAARRDLEAMGRSQFGRWYGGWWTPWEHSEIRDDRVLYFARRLWPGSYTASYVARATTSGRFIRPPAHAEEMYNPSLNGRSDGGGFRILERRNQRD